jgi:hypothetical protein
VPHTLSLKRIFRLLVNGLFSIFVGSGSEEHKGMYSLFKALLNSVRQPPLWVQCTNLGYGFFSNYYTEVDLALEKIRNYLKICLPLVGMSEEESFMAEYLRILSQPGSAITDTSQNWELFMVSILNAYFYLNHTVFRMI